MSSFVGHYFAPYSHGKHYSTVDQQSEQLVDAHIEAWGRYIPQKLAEISF